MEQKFSGIQVVSEKNFHTQDDTKKWQSNDQPNKICDVVGVRAPENPRDIRRQRKASPQKDKIQKKHAKKFSPTGFA